MKREIVKEELLRARMREIKYEDEKIGERERERSFESVSIK